MILPIYVTGHVNKCWKLLCLNLGPSLLKIKLFDPFRETVPLIGELFRGAVPLIGELFWENCPFDWRVISGYCPFESLVIMFFTYSVLRRHVRD